MPNKKKAKWPQKARYAWYSFEWRSHPQEQMMDYGLFGCGAASCRDLWATAAVSDNERAGDVLSGGLLYGDQP